MVADEKITFHKITLEDQTWVKERLSEEHLMACEYTFANNFIWGRFYQAQVAEIYGCGVIRFLSGKEYCYSFPFGGGDKQGVIELLMQQQHERGEKLVLYPVEEEQRRFLITYFPGQFEISSNRDSADYVYTVNKLMYLKGKKLHGKRNHIARFMDDEDWYYEPLTDENKDKCREMAKTWIALREEKWNNNMEMEMEVLEEALKYFEELELCGGVLYKKGELVAFTIGEPLNQDTMVVHFEKAYPTMQGAYPMINQQFVQHTCKEYQYVNREEDTGDIGLRKAKLSYYPDLLVKKYTAVESDVVFADETEWEEISRLWHTCFGDNRQYIDLYLQNRFTTDNMMVMHEDGRIVSMASVLPVEIIMQGEVKTARYIYAVATLPEYRGRGYASRIIRHVAEKYQEPLILQPAEESLKQYYAGMGFVEAFEEMHHEMVPQLQKKGHNCVTLQDIDVAEYKRIRDIYFANECYVKWDEGAVAYALQENGFCQGKAFKVILHEQKDAILMYRVQENVMYIIETTLEQEVFPEVVAMLPEVASVQKIVYNNAGGMLLMPEGMQIPEKKGYLNLTLG